MNIFTEQLISELSKQAFIWLNLGIWVGLMVWIHAPRTPCCPPARRPNAKPYYLAIVGLLGVNEIATVIRLL